MVGKALRAFVALAMLVLPLSAADIAEASSGPRSCSANERFVGAAYHDFLGRSVDNDGVLYWGSRLDAGLESPAAASFPSSRASQVRACRQSR